MSNALHGPAFDRDKWIAIIPGRHAGVQMRHITLLAALLGGTVLVAGLYDGVNPLGASLGALLVFFGTGVISTFIRNQSRIRPYLVAGKTGITLKGFLRDTHIPWHLIGEISQKLQGTSIVLLLHLKEGRHVAVHTGRIPRWAREKLFFIMKTLAQRNNVMWSVFEPARWSAPDSSLVMARRD